MLYKNAQISRDVHVHVMEGTVRLIVRAVQVRALHCVLMQELDNLLSECLSYINGSSIFTAESESSVDFNEPSGGGGGGVSHSMYSRCSRKQTPLGQEKHVGNWSWPLTRM